jgi:hypothetical protein
VRLADFVLRQGHLSERVIIDAVLSGHRPAHFERCDICAERAVDVARWLDETRAISLETADAAFPPEQLATQRSQILRRLEQLDEPARVISFPRHATRFDDRAWGGRRVAASWVAVAAAAGLVVGVIGGHVTARFSPAPAETIAATGDATVATVDATSPAPTARPIDASLLFDDDDRFKTFAVDPLGEISPRTVQARAGG